MSEEKKKGGNRWQVPVICLSAIIIVAMLCFRPGKNRKITLEKPATEEVVAAAATTPQEEQATQMEATQESVDLLYGIDRNQYYVYEGDIEQGQLLVNILQPYTKYGNILAIAEKSKSVFDLARKMQVGHHWAAFCHSDASGESQLKYFVYDINSEDILLVSVEGDNISVERKTKDF